MKDKKSKNKNKKWKKQRAKRGYADVDVWNHYDWFIHTTRKMLKKLKKNHVGFPIDVLSIANQNRLAFGSDKEKKYYSEKGSREWEEILDRMIFLLYEMDEEKCSKKNEYEKSYSKFLTLRNYEKISGYTELKNNYLNREKEIAEYQDKCKDEFFDLYKTWFWALWD